MDYSVYRKRNVVDNKILIYDLNIPNNDILPYGYFKITISHRAAFSVMRGLCVVPVYYHPYHKEYIDETREDDVASMVEDRMKLKSDAYTIRRILEHQENPYSDNFTMFVPKLYNGYRFRALHIKFKGKTVYPIKELITRIPFLNLNITVETTREDIPEHFLIR
jgi:hypothetical protein